MALTNFFNPGSLPANITVEHLLSGDYSSQARNKKIAAIFKEAQFIEKYGSGIKRILEANPHITRAEIASITNLSIRGVEYLLAKPRKSGVIQRVGSTKNGYWRIIE